MASGRLVMLLESGKQHEKKCPQFKKKKFSSCKIEIMKVQLQKCISYNNHECY
ncbi:hypothetical protein TTHERM_000049417 (macronuclear) [Tetrahymena thermophila SB210]|uniref:Uncharacterized protein n=1 Tax=Tetrahymena thermophila (strain SB210) TaxID=312017 RepID=W7XBC0_TETTS|nr:hypothetical protein TTHERM_000049417 [Tetrahymena thermophila SB210]EWS74622.1 hypothetical protein TTHERM_000049417 [Tetrahymena thermophila SB210]|eukprot:XP_012652844.1 hypothetical protein TTHERM_000049417 [Tetrahymena thermophila SB210]